jgi:hypothetical protein
MLINKALQQTGIFRRKQKPRDTQAQAREQTRFLCPLVFRNAEYVGLESWA